MLKNHLISKIFPLLMVLFLSCCSSQSACDIRQELIKQYCEAKSPEERFALEDQYASYDWTQQVLPIVTAKYSDEAIKVVVADNKEFKNAFYEKINYGHRIERGFCVPGKEHYYRIYIQKMFDLFDEEPCDALDGYKLDTEGSFTVEPNIVRFCNVDGMKNVRDLGGWNTSSGKRINYQKLYRGANFQHITENGKYEFTQTLGIKTEIDLREKGDRPDRNLIENNTFSTLGRGYDVTYVEAPIPMYSYIYHEYLNNFMGNQICYALSDERYSLTYRMAYSFISGDIYTLIINGDGKLHIAWCNDVIVDDKMPLELIKNTNKWRIGKFEEFLHYGKMVRPLPYSCNKKKFKFKWAEHTFEFNAVLSSAYTNGNDTYQFFINYDEIEETITLEDKEYLVFYDNNTDGDRTAGDKIVVPPLSIIAIKL